MCYTGVCPYEVYNGEGDWERFQCACILPKGRDCPWDEHDTEEEMIKAGEEYQRYLDSLEESSECNPLL